MTISTWIIVSKDFKRHVPRFQRGIHTVETKPIGNTYQTYTNKKQAEKSIQCFEYYGTGDNPDDYNAIEIVYEIINK